jgi:hypothetical protein
MVVLAAGCGGSSAMPSARPELDPFIGTWTITAGRIMGMCGTVPLDMAITGQQTVERGTNADLVFSVQPTCRLLMDATDQTATVRPNQACQLAVTGQSPVSGTVTGGSMKLTSAGASFMCTGAAKLLGTIDCTLSIEGTSTKTP